MIAGAERGYGTPVGQAAVDPRAVWAKLAAMAEGAKIASEAFWGGQDPRSLVSDLDDGSQAIKPVADICPVPANVGCKAGATFPTAAGCRTSGWRLRC